ncbi:MAG: class I SAM-dependent methyltransferase [Armatimonadota bacterium]|nr:MAG: class I SAM-dependent methyltransferase [Armatimonadota bacterium]
MPRRRAWEGMRQELLTARGEETRTLEIGAGGRRLTPRTVTVDLLPVGSTDVVADATRLPLRSGSFDCVWLEFVLDHCADPRSVAAEAWRVTASGGAVFAHVPWIVFYHDFPGDYWRFSVEALRALFPEQTKVETGVGYGPGVAAVSLLSELWARIFSEGDGIWPYAVLRAMALLVLFPWKYLDLVLVRTPAAQRLASTLYAVARKPVDFAPSR